MNPVLLNSSLKSHPLMARHDATPLDGDLVVTRDSKTVCYTVRQFPGVVQFSAWPRDEAVHLARSFAQEDAVDLWYCEDGSYVLLEAYRPGTAARAHLRETDIS